MTAKPSEAFDAASAMLEAFATSERINEYLLDNLSDEAWKADPPGGKGRSVAALFGHIHNVRLMWLKAAGAGGEMPAKLEGDDFSRADAAAALQSSFASVRRLIEDSLRGDGKIKGFKPNVVSFAAYLIAHDAHHRGQASLLARQCGHPVSKSTNFGMWEWGTR